MSGKEGLGRFLNRSCVTHSNKKVSSLWCKVVITLVLAVSAQAAPGDPDGELVPGGEAEARCADSSLVWRTANKTHYISYPEPGSEECIVYNGCKWEGQFTACPEKMEESWVASVNIAAVYPLFEELANHELCIRKGSRTMIVNVIDSCGDSDCDGCCTENQGDAEALIDLESYTNARWGEADSPIEWADLGHRVPGICD